MNKIKYLRDNYRPNDGYEKIDGLFIPKRGDSKVEFFNDATGERIWEPLHNKTVVAGSALTAMKLFDLDRNVLDKTPTYDNTLDLLNKPSNGVYPVTKVYNSDKVEVGSVPDETQRKIIGFCLGQGGAGLDISDVFDVKYCSWITPDDLVPFRYPLRSGDTVDEDMYKGKKQISLSNGQERNAYYFKAFSNTPQLEQIYQSNIGTFSDSIDAATVYSNKTSADLARSFVECHLKITKDDCREFFIAHKGLENAKINQISLVSAWTKTVTVTKYNSSGNSISKNVEYFQDIRPFSLLNIPNEILSDLEKSISIIYTLYF